MELGQLITSFEEARKRLDEALANKPLVLPIFTVKSRSDVLRGKGFFYEAGGKLYLQYGDEAYGLPANPDNIHFAYEVYQNKKIPIEEALKLAISKFNEYTEKLSAENPKPSVVD